MFPQIICIKAKQTQRANNSVNNIASFEIRLNLKDETET